MNIERCLSLGHGVPESVSQAAVRLSRRELCCSITMGTLAVAGSWNPLLGGDEKAAKKESEGKEESEAERLSNIYLVEVLPKPHKIKYTREEIFSGKEKLLPLRIYIRCQPSVYFFEEKTKKRVDLPGGWVLDLTGSNGRFAGVIRCT